MLYNHSDATVQYLPSRRAAVGKVIYYSVGDCREMKSCEKVEEEEWRGETSGVRVGVDDGS